jgi:hypothetical protein
MIDQKIPANQRDSVPLLVANDQILWVCGYRPDERAGLQANTQKILHLEFEQNLLGLLRDVKIFPRFFKNDERDWQDGPV